MAVNKARAPKSIGTERSSKVDPRTEYVYAGSLGGLQDSLEILQSNADSLTRKVGNGVYEQMMYDPEVYKCINVLCTGVLSDGIDFINPVPEFDDDFDEAETIRKFCKEAIKDIDLKDSLDQLVSDAMVYGHKIAEITYELKQLRGFNGKYLIPSIIKVKKNSDLSFVVDRKNNVVGFVSNLGVLNKHKLQVTEKYSSIGNRAVLPKEKFMVLSLNSKDSDPRGQSLLKPAFNAWHLKMQMWPEYLRFLLLCSVPLLVGYTPEEGEEYKEYLRDENDVPLKDSQGNLIQISKEMALVKALAKARSAEVLALKGGSKVQEIGGKSAGTAFWKALEVLDKQIEMGVLNQTLAVSEGVRQSRAAAETHRTVLDQLIWSLKGVVADMITSDLLRHMVKYNFGDSALAYLPIVTLGDAERHEFARTGSTVAQLHRVGYFQPEQLKEVDKKLGLPIRRTLDPQHLIQQLQAAGVSIQAVPPPPEQIATIQAGPGGTTTPVSASDVLRGIKGTAIGRTNSNINKSPSNSDL